MLALRSHASQAPCLRRVRVVVEPVEVVLRFDAGAFRDASTFVFHPDQSIEKNADGSLTVRFAAGGIDEMCWHLFTLLVSETSYGGVVSIENVDDPRRANGENVPDMVRECIVSGNGLESARDRGQFHEASRPRRRRPDGAHRPRRAAGAGMMAMMRDAHGRGPGLVLSTRGLVVPAFPGSAFENQ